MKQNWLYVFVGGFGVGVLFRSFFDFGFAFSIFLIALSGVLFFLYFFLSLYKGLPLISGAISSKGKAFGRNGAVFLVAVFVLATGLGVLRFDVADLDRGSPILDEIVGQDIVVEGVIIDEPDERENNTRLIIRLENIITPNEDGVSEVVNDRAIITADIYPRFVYGDKVRIEGELRKPKNFMGDDGGTFDYVSYLAKDDIFYQMFYPKIEFISGGNANPIKQTLFNFKNAFLEKVGRVIPDPQVSLLGGLVVGAKQSLGEELQEDFRKTGIIHIVVLSGYNVTIVAEAIMRSLSFLPHIFGASIGGLAIIFFALMTGASATAVVPQKVLV